jgi:hypothetical protein
VHLPRKKCVNVFICEPERIKSLRRPKRLLEDKIKMGPKEIGLGSVG